MLIKLLELFYTFFMIGLFTIGGGYAMIPMITRNVIDKGWLTYQELIDFIVIGESTPGPFAVNTATLIGFSQITDMPLLGAVVTTLAVILPSFIIILLIAKYFSKYMDRKVVKWVLGGIKAVIVGLIFAVVISLAKMNIFNGNISIKDMDIYAIIILAIILSIKVIFKKKVGPIPLIIISGFLGFIFYWII